MKSIKQVQEMVRTCINDDWLNLPNSIQQTSDTGNNGEMYNDIKKAVGPNNKKSYPFKAKSGRKS